MLLCFTLCFHRTRDCIERMIHFQHCMEVLLMWQQACHAYEYTCQRAPFLLQGIQRCSIGKIYLMMCLNDNFANIVRVWNKTKTSFWQNCIFVLTIVLQRFSFLLQSNEHTFLSITGQALFRSCFHTRYWLLRYLCKSRTKEIIFPLHENKIC